MSRGTPPRDEKFLELVKAMDEDDFLAYEIPDPTARIAGLYQHPLQKVVRNHGSQTGKKFHSWKWLSKLYIVRLPVPDQEAAKMKVPTQGASNEPNHERADDDRDRARSSEEGDVRPTGSGGSNST